MQSSPGCICSMAKDKLRARERSTFWPCGASSPQDVGSRRRFCALTRQRRSPSCCAPPPKPYGARAQNDRTNRRPPRHGERHQGPGHGRRAAGELRPSRHADGHGRRRHGAVHQVPEVRRRREPHWPDRDRFILSAGHGSMLLYSLLLSHRLRRHDARRAEALPPARQPAPPAIPNTATPAASRRRPGRSARASATRSASRWPSACSPSASARDIVDHFTYVIAGDGCLMEGIGQEAITLAGHLGLGRLIVLFDDNGISIDGPTSLATSEDHKKRFAAAGWHVQAVDGLDPDAVDARHPQGAQRHRQALDDRLQDDDRLRRADQGRHRGHARLAARQGRGRRRAPEARLEPSRRSTSPSRSSPPGARSARAASRRDANGPSATPRMAEADRAEFDRRQKGDIPPAVGEAIAAFKAKVAADKPPLGDAQVEPGGARGHQPGAARHGRRLGRPHRLEQHQDRDAEGR